jgi:hypothetical protein
MNFILDLDNTLMCSIPINNLDKLPNDINIKYRIEAFKPYDNLIYSTLLVQRPYLHEFLEELNKIGKISIWTAASSQYAKFIIDNFIPNHIEIKNVFSSFYTNKLKKITNKLKPLEYLCRTNTDYEINKTYIIDDMYEVIDANPNNSFLIKKFTMESITSPNLDNELLKILVKIKSRLL